MRTADSLAWIALPPNTRNADLGSILHGLFIGNTSAVQHGLEVKSANMSACVLQLHTWAPGKSCSLVKVVDHLFSGPPGGRHLNWM